MSNSMAGHPQAAIVRAHRRRRYASAVAAVGIALGLALIAAACTSEPDCDHDYASLFIEVSADLCRGNVTVSEPCGEPQCQERSTSPACCLLWAGGLSGSAGSVCSVVLALPDGGTATKDVQFGQPGDYCVPGQHMTLP